MRGRTSGILRNVAKTYKRKATQSRNELAYMMLWGEEPPRKKRGGRR